MALQIDPEIRAALKALAEKFGPPPVFERGDWLGIRRFVDAVMPQSQSFLPLHEEVARTNATLASGVGLRWYVPPDATAGPAVLYIHGGGMIAGTLEQYDRLSAHYAALSGVPILSVDYRLAPEHPHPVPVEDCFAALSWLIGEASRLGVDPCRIAVMGDSAGGGLAAGVALLARDRGIPLARQILVYPMLDDRTVTPDPQLAPFATWTYEQNQTGWQALLGKAFGQATPPASAAPARADRLDGVAPAYIDVGTLDIFCAEDMACAARLVAANVPVELHVHEGAPHGYELMAPDAAVSRRTMEDRIRVLRAL